MAKEDDAAYEYFSDPKYFADLFNAKCFDGMQVVDYRDLEEADGRSPMPGDATRFRDIKKRLKNGTQFIIMAIENQANVDYEIPYRIMQYDCAEYGKQIRQIHEKKADERAEMGKKRSHWLEKMDEKDRLLPVYTICFYHGAAEWSGPKSLKDMMDFGDTKYRGMWEKLFSDYRILLVRADEPGLAERCKTSLKHLLHVLGARQDKEKMRQLMLEKSLGDVDAATGKAIAVLADIPNFLKHEERYRKVDGEQEEGGSYNMCIAIRELMEEAREDGISEGISQGISQGTSQTLVKNIENLINNMKLDVAGACHALGTTVDAYENARQVIRGKR